jgi:general secretion pathway protein A
MGYLEFYGLQQEPFSNAPVSKFYFDSEQHVQALARLRRVADQMKGLAVLVGDIGAGKTTLARKMLDSLPEDQFEAALLVIIHSGITAHWLLRRIAQQLGVQNPAEEKLQLLSQLYRRLLQIAEQGKKAVVLIDEAQMLQTKELMEEFRGLLNLEVPEHKLITFIFFGLPDIEENLKLDPPLLQRVSLKWHLDAMDEASTRKYVEYRLALAGAKRPLFFNGALEAVFRFSHGIPRLINTVADNALFEGYILKAETIPQEVVENIAVDLGLSPYGKRELRLVNTTDGLAGLEHELKSFQDAPEEKTAEQFEREMPDQTQDIDSILSGLEEKL